MPINPQSEFLREPNLLVPGSKPIGPVALDYRNSLARGLVGCWIFQPGMGLVQDLTGYNHGSIVGTVKTGQIGINKGVYVPTDTTQDRITLGSISGSNPLMLPGNCASVLCRAVVSSNHANLYPRIIDKSSSGYGANGWCFYIDSESYLEFDFGSSLARFRTVSGSITSGIHTIGVSIDTTTVDGRFFHVDGEQKTAGTYHTGLIPQSTANASLLNWNHTSDRQYRKPIEFIYVWDRVLPLAEHRALVRDPYQILIPA